MCGSGIVRVVVLLAVVSAGCAAEERPPFAPGDEAVRRDGGTLDDGPDGGRDPTNVNVSPGFVVSDKVDEWGADTTDPPKICAGDSFSCGITPEGLAACWGYSEIGILAIPSALTKEKAVMITCGGSHACALTDGGDIHCWGNNKYGQGDVPEGSYKSVSAGAVHTCAIDEHDEIVCWGAGQPGDDNLSGVTSTTVQAGQSSPPTGKFRGLSAGYLHTCAIEIRNDRALCWGLESARVGVPKIDLERVSGGWFHTCALDFDGEIHCWGEGDDDNAPCETLGGPLPNCGQGVPPEGRFLYIASAASHSCGITEGLELKCWGDNTYKQLDVPKTKLPGMGSFASGYVQVAGSDNHTCAISAAGLVQCWGHDGNNKIRVPADLFDEAP